MLSQVGVISGNDITPEAALAKLSYILSKDDWDLSTKRMVNIYTRHKSILSYNTVSNIVPNR